MECRKRKAGILMDYTIYSAGVHPAEKSGPASNYGKDPTNPAAQTGAAGFGGVVISAGDALSARKLEENTYTGFLKETEDVRAQIMAGATNAKANLKALFNRLSGADAVQIDAKGFDLYEAAPEDLVNIVDRIKIELAAHGDSYPAAAGGVRTDQIEQVVGSAGYAQAIAGKMQASGIPLTDENISDMADALKKVSERTKISEAAKNYMVQNRLEPTIENIYLAEHAAGTAGEPAAGGNAGQPAPESLTPSAWEQLEPQVSKLMEQAGLTATESDCQNAKTLIEQGIPVTVDNLLLKARLDQLTLSDGIAPNTAGDVGPVIERIVAHMAEGGTASGTLLSTAESVYQQVLEAQEIIRNADCEQVALAVRNAAKKQEPVCLYSIEEAARQLAEQKQQGAKQEQPQPAAQDAYRKIMQIRILMTAGAGIFLAKQGVSLKTVSIVELESRLEAYDRQLYGMEAPGTDGEAAAKDLSAAARSSGRTPAQAYELTLSVRRALLEISEAPDVSIGAVLKDLPAAFTLPDFAAAGSRLKERFLQAGETYEAVGTQKRSDLGDSFTKAVKASTVDILNGLGLENTAANADAVRILGYNEMEMTPENIDRIKELHATLKSLVKNMRPDKVLTMLRENVNPMTADIHTVNEYLRAQEESNDVQKYSTFLYKLDRTDGITEEERKQFIGIYKMMNLFEKDAGAAIGALVKQNAEITMENLCRTYSSRKSLGTETAVADEAEIAAAGTVDYYLNLFDETAVCMTPLTLKNVQQRQPVLSRSVENFCDAVQETYDAAEEAAYYEAYLETARSALEAQPSVIRALENAQQPVTVANIQAMEQMMQAGFFNRLFGDNRNKVAEFVEKTGDKTQLEDAFLQLKADSDAQLQQQISETSGENVQDHQKFEALRMKNRQIGMIANLSLRHDYRIPFLTEEGVGMMKLTLVKDPENTGRISLHFDSETLGTVSVEAKVSDQSIRLFGVCQEQEQQLSEKLDAVAQRLKADYDTAVQVVCSRSLYVNRITYDNAAGTIPTSQLYQMAKTIIEGLL